MRCQQVEERSVEDGEQELDEVLADDDSRQHRPFLRRPEPFETDAERDADEKHGVDDLAGSRAGVVPEPTAKK